MDQNKTIQLFWLFCLVIACLIHASDGFLLESSTVASQDASSHLTYRHYMQMMELLFEEKQARHQLEDKVLKLQNKLDSQENVLNISNYIQPYVHRLQNSENELFSSQQSLKASFQRKEKEIALLQTRVTSLEQNYTTLASDCSKLRSDNNMLKQELEALKQIKNIDVASSLIATKQEVNQLKIKSQARSQDFVALYNMTLSYKQDVNKLSKEFKNTYNDSTIDEIMDKLQDKINLLDQAHNSTSTVLRDVIQNMTKRVGFTACGAHVISGNIVNFLEHHTVFGLSLQSSYRNGRFHVAEDGFYFVFVNVLGGKGALNIILNDATSLSRAWYKSNTSGNGYYTASTSAFTKLSKGDVISVTSPQADAGSCLTLMKM